ncbi:MAG: tetratricopeptide repeat protein [Fuerstiella sp.]
MLNASGMNLYDKGNYALAAQDFQTAVANNPQNPDYVSNLAKARMKMGDGTGAEQLFRQALTTNPGHQPSYHGLSELMLAQGRSQEATQMLQTWAATQPYVAESHVEMAWLQRELGQHDAAAQSLQSALQANPNHPTALAHLGQFYHDNGQPQQAVAMYQRSLQADWDQPHVHNRLAAVAQSTGANHPMGQIAMARGVHPQDIPRQELAFGAAQQNFAMQAMPQSAMQAPMVAANSGFPGQPPMNQQAFMPASDHQAHAGIPSAPWSPVANGSAFAPMGTSPVATPQVAGLPPMYPGMMPAPVASMNSNTSNASFGSGNQGSVPAPAPDAAFNSLPPLGTQTSSLPVQGVSQSRIVEGELIELDAF